VVNANLDKRDRCRHILLPARFFAVTTVGGVEGAQSTVRVRTLDLQSASLVSNYAGSREVRRISQKRMHALIPPSMIQ
jgi:hypothetical protein